MRRWTGTPTVTFASRSAHSSAAFAKQSSDEDHVEGVPTSSTMDRRVVVEWGQNEKSRLCVGFSLSRGCGADVDGQP